MIYSWPQFLTFMGIAIAAFAFTIWISIKCLPPEDNDDEMVEGDSNKDV